MVDLLEKNLYYFKACLEPYGFEVYPFLVDWYNRLVDKPFKLDYPRFTLAYVVISTPSVFENVFIPFIKESSDSVYDDLRDPIDTAIHNKLEEAREECTLINNETIEILHDYDLTPNRRPVIHVQTAGDVAGAVRLYQGSDLDESHKFETPSGRIYPCALHPKYGGWFAIRAVYIFKKLIHPLLEEQPRLDILESQSEIRSFLEKFNLQWEDWSYRDVIEPIERYSEIQKRYFGTLPEKRKHLLTALKEYDSANEDAEPGKDVDEKGDSLLES